MVRVGFVVEGDTEKAFVESVRFSDWLKNDYGLEVVRPVVNAAGGGNLCSRRICDLVKSLKLAYQPEKIVVLADLDPDQCAPCITQRKEIIGTEGIDLVVIARKALESWFLADTAAMRHWTGDKEFYEPEPEDPVIEPETRRGMPWERLKQIRNTKGRGPGEKLPFAKKFITDHHFDLKQAAAHPNCPSARYFVQKLAALSGGVA